MEPYRIIDRSEIQEPLVQEMVEALSHFTIGFYETKNTGSGAGPQLLGSGTLVMSCGKYAILTAQHVLEVLPTNGNLGVLIQHSQTIESININTIKYISIARGSVDIMGPDLGLVAILSQDVASALAAKKSFFDLDLYRETLCNGEIDFRNELWISQGFVDERTSTREAPERGCLVREFHNLCGFGQPSQHYFSDGFDFIEFPFNRLADPLVPSKFGGTSGGAFWQIPLFRNESNQVSFQKPCLRGVIFAEEFSGPGSGVLRGHGPKSIYTDVIAKMSST